MEIRPKEKRDGYEPIPLFVFTFVKLCLELKPGPQIVEAAVEAVW